MNRLTFQFARGRHRRQEGYALLLVVFLTALLLISAMAAAPSIRTERRREKEEEMVWRGKQYVRAIKLFYRKTGRFPTSMDDLVKPQVGNIRFLRQAYKDPMNKEDGAWRLIYVGPSGQLIGSLKPPQTMQMPGVGAQIGTPASALSSPGFGQTPIGAPPGAQPPGAPAGAATSGGAAQPGAPGAQGAADPNAAGGNQQPDGAAPNASLGGLTPSEPGDASNIIGGNIIGVGSKINKASIMVYEKAKNYRLFEFIWDPSKDVTGDGQQGTQIGTPIAPGQPGGAPGMPGAPGQMGPGFGPGSGSFGQQPPMNPMGPQPSPQPNPTPPQP